MALKKIKEKRGHNNEYWRIIQINSNLNREDAVVTFALYKDKATRDADVNAVVDQYQVDLGKDLLDKAATADKVKNINLKQAYTVFKKKAKDEEAKRPDLKEGEILDEELAWFNDVVDI